jgi:hypothetical protein
VRSVGANAVIVYSQELCPEDASSSLLEYSELSPLGPTGECGITGMLPYMSVAPPEPAAESESEDVEWADFSESECDPERADDFSESEDAERADDFELESEDPVDELEESSPLSCALLMALRISDSAGACPYKLGDFGESTEGDTSSEIMAGMFP